MTSPLNADLVLEGGGVKGIALAGAVSVLEERGYQFHKIAGTSTGFRSPTASTPAAVAATTTIRRWSRSPPG